MATEATHKEVNSKEEFLKERQTHMADLKVDASRLLEEIDGSFAIIALNYDENDPSEVDGDRIFLGISGDMHDILALLRALERAKNDLIVQTVKSLDNDEARHFVSHLKEEI